MKKFSENANSDKPIFDLDSDYYMGLLPILLSYNPYTCACIRL